MLLSRYEQFDGSAAGLPPAAGVQAHTSTGPMLVAVKSGLDQSGIPTTVDGSKNRSPGPTACSANQPAAISTA